MDFRILGPLEVSRGGTALPLPAAKQQALLGVLLLHPDEMLSRERLIDELWGEKPPRTAVKALQTYVSELRKLLEPETIITQPGGYRIELAEHELDSARFKALVAAARSQAEAGHPDEAREAYRDALSLWRGPALSGVLFESFARNEVEALEELRLSSLADRIDCDLALGRHADVIGELETLVARYPLRESFRAQLMLALYRAGRQADALDLYQRTRRELVAELGVEPSQELRQLERRILDHDPELLRARDAKTPTNDLQSGATRSRIRHRRLALVAAALAVAGAAAAGAVLATGSASAKPVRLIANSIAVVDSRSGRPVGDVPLGFPPTDVVAGGDRIWVLNKPARTATAIDPKTLHVLRTFGLSGDPVSQYATGDTDWVVMPGAVDEVQTTGVTRIPLWKPVRVTLSANPPLSAECAPFVTGNAKRVWVSEVRHLAVFDASSRTLLSRSTLPVAPGAPADSSCYGVRYANGELLAVRDPDETVGRLDPRTGALLPILTRPDFSAAVGLYGPGIPWTAGFGHLWLTSSQLIISTGRLRGDLISYDLGNGQQTGRTPIGTAANDFDRLAQSTPTEQLTIDPAGGVWVLTLGRNALMHVDPSTGQPSRPVPLHHVPCCIPPNASGNPTVADPFGNALAAGHGRVWIALQSP